MERNPRPVKGLPPIGALAFICLILGGTFALIFWNGMFFVVGLALFLILAIVDSIEVGKGR